MAGRYFDEEAAKSGDEADHLEADEEAERELNAQDQAFIGLLFVAIV